MKCFYKVAAVLIMTTLKGYGQQKVDYWYRRGVVKFNKNNYIGALNDLEKVQVPSTALFNIKGTANLNLGRYNKALQYFNMAIGFDNIDIVGFINRGILNTKLKKYKSAINDFDEALRRDSINKLVNNIDFALNKKGLVMDKIGNYYEALKYFNNALIYNHEYSDAYNNKGISEFHLGHYFEAIKNLDSAIKYNSNNAKAYNNRGFIYYKLGKSKSNFKNALKDYEKAIKLGGKNFIPDYFYKTKTLRKLNM